MADDLGALVAKLQADVGDLKKGLAEGRQDFKTFQGLIESGTAQIKKVLSFAGISLGLYGIISEAKAFSASILEVGKKSEVLRGAAYAIGDYYNISSQAIDLYVNKLTQSGISTENALQSINNFLKAGLSVDLLPQLAAAAKDLAPTMAMPFNEAFEAIIQSVTKGTPKALAELTPGIKQAVQAASSETQKMMDSTILSGTERSKIMVDFVLAAASKMQGAGDSMAGTYLKQINDYKRTVREVKEALFEIVKPISMAITGAEIKSWQDLYVWVIQNKAALKETAQGIADFIESFTSTAKAIGAFILQHKELLKILLEVYVLSKAAGWFVGVVSGIGEATAGVVGLSAKLAVLRAAISVPWALVIAVSVIGLYEGAKAIQTMVKRQPSAGTSMLMGEAEYTLSPSQRDQLARQNQEADEKARIQALKETHKGKGPVSAFGGEYKPEKSPAEAKAEADAAAKLAELENKLKPKTGKGGGGASTEGLADKLLTETLKMLKAKREAELQEAENSLELLKSTNAQKRAELAKSLAAELIDGETYYKTLQDLQQEETNAALVLIEKKKQIQIQAHKEALQNLADKTLPGFKDLSEDARAIAQQTLEAQHRKEMSKLATETAKTKIDGEVKVTEELKRQVEVQKQFTQKVEDLELSSAWGPIAEQEARLQQLYLEWQRAKADALAAGVSPELLARMETAYQGKAWAASPEAQQAQEMAQSITNSFSSIVDAMMSGTSDLKTSLNSMFKGVFNEALKPGLKALEQLLMDGFKQLFGSVGAGVGGAIMGVIGLVGMMLTSGGEKSSWTPSGVQSAVTGHEAVRGLIAGETSTPTAEIATSLQDALVETNGILLNIEANTRGGGGGGGGGQIDINIQGIQESIRETLDAYFRDYLLMGARG